MSEATKRAAIVHVPLDLLAQLLQLPAGAHIDSAHYDPADYASLRLRVVGAGWIAQPGSILPISGARITEYRDDDGRCFKRVIAWDMPMNVKGEPR